MRPYTHLNLHGLPVNRELLPEENLMLRLALAVGHLANEAGDEELIDEVMQAIAEWMRDKRLVDKSC